VFASNFIKEKYCKTSGVSLLDDVVYGEGAAAIILDVEAVAIFELESETARLCLA
jgi:hypothetical protein